ncbi:MAG: carboxypeptidase-like regulatory domain-containing protein [Planctomycetes bacterium]|nr:carboxypeptidase-like regulatory domain-containing protein [Planctomycetota bacterium]
MSISSYLLLAVMLSGVLLTAGAARGDEKNHAITGVVCDAAGKPVAGAEVSLIRPESGGRLDQRGRFEVYHTAPQTQCDGEGRFTFEPTEGTFSLLAQGPAGYAVVTSEAFRRDARITLHAWGRVEGTFHQAGKAMAKARFDLRGSWSAMPRGAPFILFNAHTLADEQGRFVFDQVAEGALYLTYFAPTMFIVNDVHHGETVTWRIADVKPDQTLTLALGNTGRPVVGRIAPPSPGHVPADFDMSHVAGLFSVEPDYSLAEWPETCDEMSMEQQAAWLKSTEGADWQRRWREASNGPWSAGFCVHPDGTFRVEGVPPGRYRVRSGRSGSRPRAPRRSGRCRRWGSCRCS